MKTPDLVCFLAIWLATLDSTFVDAMPIDTGMPVHCFTFSRNAIPLSLLA